MNEITQWLNAPDKTYQSGVEIYNRHKIGNKHDAFFASVADPSFDEVQFKMLIYHLTRIARKLGDVIQEEPVKKPIKVLKLATETKEDSFDAAAMRYNKQYINRLLTMNWENLNEADRSVFYDNQIFYLMKQKALYEISDLKNESHQADAKRKSTKSRAVRKTWNDRMNEIEKKIRHIFKTKIDSWDDPNTQIQGDSNSIAAMEAVNRERRIRYLKGTALPRAKKELLNNAKLTDKQKKDRQENILAWEKELTELEIIHQL